MIINALCLSWKLLLVAVDQNRGAEVCVSTNFCPIFQSFSVTVLLFIAYLLIEIKKNGISSQIELIHIMIPVF